MVNETPRIAILDCSTGITTEREMNAEELADLEVRSVKAAEQRAIEEAEKERVAKLKESARTKLVAGEPLTEEEAATIVL
jgi:hypothetical protein